MAFEGTQLSETSNASARHTVQIFGFAASGGKLPAAYSLLLSEQIGLFKKSTRDKNAIKEVINLDI